MAEGRVPRLRRTPLDLTRSQILAFRRHVGALDERLPSGPRSLRRAAWAGLQDSMPRAALLSIHARVEGTRPSTWEDPSLVQVWGPRFNVYVVPERDRAFFTLARLPENARGRARAEELAGRLEQFLGDRRLTDREIGRALGVGNEMRYATATGTLLIRWEGARAPVVWIAPRPELAPADALRELARRYLHVYGPATAAAFTKWAGVGAAEGRAAFDALGRELTAVRTPIGDGWILSRDEAALRSPPEPAAGARFLPSGDAYFLLYGADRELLVPGPAHRPLLWTERVWPGALLVDGEIVGTWRRAQAKVTIQAWQRVSRESREVVVAEAESLPLPETPGRMVVDWE